MARSKEATKRAAAAYFQRNRDNPIFKAKRVAWVRKWRHANPDFFVTVRHRFNVLRAKCKHRNIEMLLTLEQYRELVEGKPCHYCGMEIVSSGSGLDRIDNSNHYVPGNCVPCCYRCNAMKSDLSTDDFYEQIERILDYRTRRGPSI